MQDSGSGGINRPPPPPGAAAVVQDSGSGGINRPPPPPPGAAAEDPQLGEVHVHEDGFVHTHGAGSAVGRTVEYTPEGLFVPERLDIVTGDTVTFVNNSNEPVWPASNIHPTHEILSSFDPLEVIWPGESWSYTFTENGYWRYHNHIEASQTGIVVALGGPEAALAPMALDLQELSFPAAPTVTQGSPIIADPDALEEFVTVYGPAATVVRLKAEELAGGGNCHNAAHDAGRVAYEKFGPVAFAVSGHECQAGAMHGAIEALFAERGTARLAEDVSAVCSQATNGFVLHQCLHGVGHGLMAWTTYEIHEALELCDVLPATSGVQRRSCYSGVYMENIVGGLSGAMGHQTEYLRYDDPHFPCDVVAPRYMPDCYFYQTSHMLVVFGRDYAAVASECTSVALSAQVLCFASYGRDVGAATRGDPARAIELCSFAPEGLYRTHCIAGAVQDRFWDPSGAEEAVEFCRLLGDSGDAADWCWDTIIERARGVLADSAAKQAFCDRVPDSRREGCLITTS